MNIIAISLLCALAATALGDISTNIVGGAEADPNELPWQGSLQILNGGNWYHLCGCALYSNNRALTVAHCLGSGASSYRVVFGMRSYSSTTEPHQSSLVSDYSIHPDYNGNDNGFPNDIAVIRLATIMDTSGAAVKAVSLAQGSADFAGESCVMSGWGRLSSTGVSPDILHKVNLTVLANTDCEARWVSSGITNAHILQFHICGFETGKSMCSGDTGGPLVCDNTLVGVTSWGLSSCTGEYPTVFSRISHYYTWISNQ